MPSPINYAAAMPQIDLGQSFRGLGNAILDARQFRQEQDQYNARQARTAEIQTDLKTLSMKPDATPADYRAVILRNPEVAEPLQKAMQGLAEEQRASTIKNVTPAVAALNIGRFDVATSELRRLSGAAKNSGMPEQAQQWDQWAAMVEQDPQQAKFLGNFILAAQMGDDYEKTFSGLQTNQRADALQPQAERKATAEADSAQVTAKYADQTARLALAGKAEDIRASKENTRLRAMEAVLSRETNDLKRQELEQKIDAARKEVEVKAAERIAEADTAVAGIDDAKKLLGGLLAPDNRDNLLAAIGGGALRASVPGTKARSVAAQIEQLQNSIAAANLDKLKGAMSDKDIIFLKNISTSLDRYQNEAAFIKELERIGTTLDSGRERIVKKYGESVPEDKRNPPTEPSVDDLLKKYGGG